MNNQSIESLSNVWSRRGWWLAVPSVAALVVILYANVSSNPPGYYIDESSISYNAYLIAQSGHDEYGRSWPLYFRAFGDFKNPIYIYVLAALFKVTGPSIIVARLLSAAFGIAAALLLGLLGSRITKNHWVGLLLILSALLTPWLFEMSRMVFEVALYPLALILFLLCLRRASEKSTWSLADILGVGLSLALLTYSYSIGRLLGPLLAFGLILFVSKIGWKGIAKIWVAYLLTLIPLFIYTRRYPGALGERFNIITYVTRDRSAAEIAIQFLKHYFGNLNPWKLLVTGDPNPNQVTHIYGSSLLLAGTFLLVLLGAYLILRYQRSDRWWRYVVYALAASVVPASLTSDYVHMLRLAPLPIFLLVITVPAIEWLLSTQARRRVLGVIVALLLIQGIYFQTRFRAAPSVNRQNLFDVGYPAKIFVPALSLHNRPIYLADALGIPGYIQAYWYGVLHGVAASEFVRLPPDHSPPKGALVITTEVTCQRCQIIAVSDFYKLYLAGEPAPARTPFEPGAFHAVIRVISGPSVLHVREAAEFKVVVKNDGDTIWPAQERSGSPLQVALGNHWLDSQGQIVVNDDGRAAILKDVKPGEELEMSLKVNAPGKPGDYLLELDMLQEGVSWFGLKGSPTIKVHVRVL